MKLIAQHLSLLVEESGEPNAFACYNERGGLLHVECVSLRGSHLSCLEDLLLATGENKRIQHLHLFDCRLAEEPSTTLPALLRLLQAVPNLQWLDMSNNNLDNHALDQILEGISGHLILRSVKLEDNQLRGLRGGLVIHRFLRQNPSVTRLNISENEFLHEGAMVLADAFARHGNLQYLNIANIGVHDGGPNARIVIEALTESFLRNPSLKELQWSVVEPNTNAPSRDSGGTSTGVSGRDTLAVARLLEQHPSLEELSVIQCPTFWDPKESEEHNLKLAQVLGKNRTLQSLTLEGCGITDETVVLLCEHVLLCNPSLKNLNLLSNDLGSKGQDALHKVIPKLKYLRSLSIEVICEEDSKAFVQALEKNKSLTHVQVLESPDTNIAPLVEEITSRNDCQLKADSFMRDTQATDTMWGKALANLASKPGSSSSMYQMLQQRRWTPSSSANTMPPMRKRARLT